jgi:DNA-binding XRE family transcriptional regulator
MTALRKAIGMTQDELASALGMSRKAINEMENGDGTIDKRTELAIRYVTLKPPSYTPRLTKRMSDIEWREAEGGYKATFSGFTAYLGRQSKDRWSIAIRHDETGYSPSWSRWEDTLEGAKAAAYLAAQVALVDMTEVQNQ